MSPKPVTPHQGKYTIPGKNNRNLELTLDDKALDKYIVEEMSEDQDMKDKIPADARKDIVWFACFSIYDKNKNGGKGNYAKVKYSFTVNMDQIQNLYVAYDGKVHDVTEEIKRDGRVKLSVGDPPVGHYP